MNEHSVVCEKCSKALVETSYWAQKVSEEQFYTNVLLFDDDEVCMYDVKPWHVKINTDA
ncbi:MAG: hypothetical protein HQL78_13200 [Magnetococcales bacterium]|nr:hypothetical protein [Magnetococcales bacterium]